MPQSDQRQCFFFIGKGGVGKSTTSALSARYLAGLGHKVLLLSLDPAHNQADIFDQPFSGRPRTVSPNLQVAELDHPYWVDRYLKGVRDHVKRTYAYQSAFNLETYLDVMRDSPGIEEYGLLLAFQHYREAAADIDCLVVDMPPTALSLKFFQLPSLTLRWLDHLLDLRQEILQKKEIISKIQLGSKVVETDKILGKLKQQTGFYTQLRHLFKNPDATRIHLVLNPERLALSETRRICDSLRKIGLDSGLQPVLNKGTAETPDLPDDLFPGLDIPQLPLSPRPLIGDQALDQFLQTNRNNFCFLTTPQAPKGLH